MAPGRACRLASRRRSQERAASGRGAAGGRPPAAQPSGRRRGSSSCRRSSGQAVDVHRPAPRDGFVARAAPRCPAGRRRRGSGPATASSPLGRRWWPKYASRAATAIRVPGSSSARGRQPASVRNGCDAVVRTTRPEPGAHLEHRLHAVVDERRRRGHLRTGRCGRATTTCTHSPADPRRYSSSAVTSSPVAGSSISVSQATHLPIDGRAPTTFSVEGCKPGQQLVEVGEAGRRAGDGDALLVARARGRSGRAAGGRRSATVRVDHPVLGDLEHLRLGLVEHLGDVVGLVVGELGDVRRPRRSAGAAAPCPATIRA